VALAKYRDRETSSASTGGGHLGANAGFGWALAASVLALVGIGGVVAFAIGYCVWWIIRGL